MADKRTLQSMIAELKRLETRASMVDLQTFYTQCLLVRRILGERVPYGQKQVYRASLEAELRYSKRTCDYMVQIASNVCKKEIDWIKTVKSNTGAVPGRTVLKELSRLGSAEDRRRVVEIWRETMPNPKELARIVTKTIAGEELGEPVEFRPNGTRKLASVASRSMAESYRKMLDWLDSQDTEYLDESEANRCGLKEQMEAMEKLIEVAKQRMIPKVRRAS